MVWSVVADIESQHPMGPTNPAVPIPAPTAFFVIPSHTVDTTPITADAIIYDANPQEVTLLLTTVIQMRAEWYQLPATIPATETDEPKGKKKRKNV